MLHTYILFLYVQSLYIKYINIYIYYLIIYACMYIYMVSSAQKMYSKMKEPFVSHPRLGGYDMVIFFSTRPTGRWVCFLGESLEFYFFLRNPEIHIWVEIQE